MLSEFNLAIERKDPLRTSWPCTQALWADAMACDHHVDILLILHGLRRAMEPGKRAIQGKCHLSAFILHVPEISAAHRDMIEAL